MNGQEFLKAHEEWKHGTPSAPKPDEIPGIWIMAESGWYEKVEPLALDDTLADLRAKGMPYTIYLNTTSTGMRDLAAEIVRERK